jgi:hypothetical protein
MRPAFGLMLVGWLCVAGAAFVALFDHHATDDYAGWVPATVAVQVPAILAIWPSRRASRLAGARRWALALPAALVTGIAAFWLTMPIGTLMGSSLLAFAPLLLGLMAVIAAGVGFARILRDVPHPRGARLVLLVVIAVGAAGVGATALWFGDAVGTDAALWLVVVAPVAWALPLRLLVALEPPKEPPIPRVIVAS